MDALTDRGDGGPVEARALLALAGLPAVGLVTVARLIEAFGSGQRALSASSADFAAVAGPRAARGRARGHGRAVRNAEATLAQAQSAGIDVIPLSAESYPTSLRELPDPPAVLFTLGDPGLLQGSIAVTVVGSRRATQRARDVAERLGAALARREGTVVSGLALGVDGSAHLGALDASEGRTVAVLGNGVDVVYPRSHRHLYERIRSHGLLVSEFTPGTGAQPHHFPRRNRVLAALGATTVVVEAGVRSGALITVDHALDLGRDVWAVPGPIDSAACQGSNRLLADGARPLVSLDDFVTAMCGVGAVGESTAIGGDERERRILAVLASETVSVDRLVEVLGLPVSDVLSLLTLLEIHGEVRRLPGMRFRRAA